MSDRNSSRTARFTNLEFEPLQTSGRLGRSSDRLRGRPSNETQRLTPLQADLLGEVRAMRGHSARLLGARLPLQRKPAADSAPRHTSGGISVRLVRAVSGRLAEPLRKLTGEERFLARWTLLVTAASAPLAMLCFTLLVGLELPTRQVAEGAHAPAAERTAVAVQPQGSSPLSATLATPRRIPLELPVARDLGWAHSGIGPLAAKAVTDRQLQGHEPPVATVAAGIRTHPEERALASGGAAAYLGTPGATRSGSRSLPVLLTAFDHSWRELTVDVGFPASWELLAAEPGQALYEAGAELRFTPRPGGATLTLLRPEGADPVGDGEVAVLEFRQGPSEGGVQVRVASELAIADPRERRLILD